MDQLPFVSVTFVNTLFKNELMELGLVISNLDFGLFILCPDCGRYVVRLYISFGLSK